MKKVKRRRNGEEEEAPKSSMDQRYLWVGGLGIVFLLAIVGLVFATRPPSIDPTVYVDVNTSANIIGEADAPVLVRDYSDFKCPHCRKASTTLVPRLIDEYVKAGTIRFELVPVGFSDESSFAAQAALCAGDQEQFWPYHDILFEQQDKRFSVEQLLQFGRDLGLEDQALRDCILSGKYKSQIDSNLDEFQAIGGTGTPTFVVGDETIPSGTPSFETLQLLISQKLEE